MGYVVVKQELGNQIYQLIGETEKAIICVQIGLTSLVQDTPVKKRAAEVLAEVMAGNAVKLHSLLPKAQVQNAV